MASQPGREADSCKECREPQETGLNRFATRGARVETLRLARWFHALGVFAGRSGRLRQAVRRVGIGCRCDGRRAGLLFEGCVELYVRWREVDTLGVVAGFLCTGLAVHAAVLPFDRERTGVPDVVQGADDFLEVHAAATQ